MIECKTREWGNSIGLIIPRDIVRKHNIKPNEEIFIDIEKKSNVLKKLFGSLKTKKPTEQLIKESRGELKSKWLK